MEKNNFFLLGVFCSSSLCNMLIIYKQGLLSYKHNKKKDD